MCQNTKASKVKHNSSALHVLQVACVLGVPVDQQRYWLWHDRHGSNSHRPNQRLDIDDLTTKMIQLQDHVRKVSTMMLMRC